MHQFTLKSKKILFRNRCLTSIIEILRVSFYQWKRWTLKKSRRNHIFSHTPCHSVEDVLNFGLEIGSFCPQAAAKTFDFVFFFGDETFRNEKRR